MESLRSDPLLEAIPTQSSETHRLDKPFDGGEPVGTLAVNQAVQTSLTPEAFVLAYLQYVRSSDWAWIRVNCSESGLVSLDATTRVHDLYRAVTVIDDRRGSAVISLEMPRSGAYFAPYGSRRESIAPRCPATLRHS
jgi:hypothetical protein